MAERSRVGWTDSTHNEWKICSPVSPGCDHCYAAALARRWGWGEYKQGVPRQLTSEANRRKPHIWNRKLFYECDYCGWRGDKPLEGQRCAVCGHAELKSARRRVFCASLADWLDNEVPIAWLVDLLDLIRRTPNLDWQLLTKRIGNWRKRLEEAAAYIEGNLHRKYEEERRNDLALLSWLRDWLVGKPPANVWIGATVVNQDEASRDIPKLLATPAAIRFLSMEPLLGPVYLRDLYIGFGTALHDAGIVAERHDHIDPLHPHFQRRIDQVIVGGESKQPGFPARRFDPEWARDIVRQCKAAGVAAFVKQMGSTPVHVHPGGTASTVEFQQILDNSYQLQLKDKAGADPSEWPEDLRVQEFPR